MSIEKKSGLRIFLEPLQKSRALYCMILISMVALFFVA